MLSTATAHGSELGSSDDECDDEPGKDADTVVGMSIALDGVFLSERCAHARERHEQSYPSGSQHRTLLVWPEPAHEHGGSPNERLCLRRPLTAC